MLYFIFGCPQTHTLAHAPSGMPFCSNMIALDCFWKNSCVFVSAFSEVFKVCTNSIFVFQRKDYMQLLVEKGISSKYEVASIVVMKLLLKNATVCCLNNLAFAARYSLQSVNILTMNRPNHDFELVVLDVECAEVKQ